MSRSKRLVSLFAVAAWLAVGALMVPPPAGAQEEVAPAPAKPPAPYTGVKKRIAVAKFDAGGTYAAHFTGWDSGGGGGRLSSPLRGITDRESVFGSPSGRKPRSKRSGVS